MSKRNKNRWSRPSEEKVSPAQLAANRANAELSTGPITQEGRAKSSLNAVKTALTGRTVLLPTDDAAEYERHMQSYEGQFAPVGQLETDLVRSLAETAWRLLRIPSLENAIYAKGHIEFAEQFEDEDPAVRPHLILLETHMKYERQIRNLQLQEARLVRRREKELAELRQLQKERKEQEAEQAQPAPTKAQMNKAVPPNGFDFSTAALAMLQTSLQAPGTNSQRSEAA